MEWNYPFAGNTTNNAETGLITLAVAATLSVFSPGKSDVRRVLIVFREASKYKIVSKYINNAYNSGRYIMLNVLIDNDPVVLVNYRVSKNEHIRVLMSHKNVTIASILKI